MTEVNFSHSDNPANTDDISEPAIDIDPGHEPGGNSEHYLVIDDEDDTEESAYKSNATGYRRRSSTISKLKKARKHEEKQLLSKIDSLKVQDSYISSDDAGNSSNVSESESDCATGIDSDYNAESLATTVTEHRSRSNTRTSEADSELEYVQSDVWKRQQKHVFVLSQSGKPIYSRYGNEEKLVTTYGVMQALVSFISHGDDEGTDLLRCVISDDRKIVFLVKEHLIMVAVSGLDESIKQIQLQLQYVYNQIISVLTLKQVNKIYQHRVNYDLRRMLVGTEKFIDNLLHVMETDTSYVLGSVRCLPLNASVRENISQTLLQSCKIKELVFALIISDNQLVTLVRMKKFSLHPHDLHLLLNLVQSSESFKTAEAWLPVCLPKFDDSGYLYAYVSYLDEHCNACLLMLTVDSGQFPELSECQKKIVERLNRHSCLQSIAESVSSQGYTTEQVGIPELRHFIYKSRSTNQFTCPRITAPYISSEQKMRLHCLYLKAHSRMHSAERPARIYFQTSDYESILGWLTDGFELYMVFSPLITKTAAVQCVNKLLKWTKKEETRLFISSQTTF